VTGALIVTVGAAHLTGAHDPSGRAVAAALLGHGVPVASRQCVDDDETALEAALRHAAERYPLLVVLAGAGGAAGDIVRRTVARVTGTRLVLSDRMLRELEGAFRRRERTMPRRAERLALLPQGAAVWPSSDGEPGWALEGGGAGIVVLPTAADALPDLLQRHVVPYARERFAGKDTLLVRTLRTVGVGAADVEERIGAFLGHEGDTSVTATPVDDEVWVRLRARAASLPVATDLLARLETQVAACLGDDVYGRDSEALEHVVGAMLEARGLSLAVAESCTGGLVGHRLSSVAGSSAYFDRGVIVHSDGAARDLLGVPDELLERHGVVSAPCAEAMARGIRAVAGSACGISTTGIAGPDGASASTPVGTVFVGLALDGQVSARRFRFAGDRESIKWQSSQVALDALRRALLRWSGRA
jgi:nicotinamide-nucleotide amidase